MTDSISILIIEGEPNLRRELALVLTKVGFTVAEMRDYPEALQKLGEFKPDIAIVDEALPSGDGKDTCYKLRNAFSIPVILFGKDSSGEAWKAAATSDYKGKKYSFCAAECKKAFDQDPEKYLAGEKK